MSKALSTNSTLATSPRGGLDQKIEQYYSAGWQLLEERVDDGWTSGFTADRNLQYLWGTRYIDDVVMHREDVDGDGDFTDAGTLRWWHLTDVQFSTIAVIDDSATLQERVTYDAYGKARHHDDKDVDGDGDFDSADRTILTTLVPTPLTTVPITSASYNADCDLDRNGVLNNTDLTLMGTSYVAALPAGDLSNATVKNTIGWDGYIFNAEITPGRSYLVRFRSYDTHLGRWVERDPAEYVDGQALYEYLRGAPTFGLDPAGLSSCPTNICGPDVTHWFVEEMQIHATFWRGTAAKRIGILYRPMYFSSYAATIPYKHMNFDVDGCPQGPNCANTVTFCQRCIHNSELGNIMFGFIGDLFVAMDRALFLLGWKIPQGISSTEDMAGVFAGEIMGWLYKNDMQLTEANVCGSLSLDYGARVAEAAQLIRRGNGLWRLLVSLSGNMLNDMDQPECAPCDTSSWNGAHSNYKWIVRSSNLLPNWWFPNGQLIYPSEMPIDSPPKFWDTPPWTRPPWE